MAPTANGFCALCDQAADVQPSTKFIDDEMVCERCGRFRLARGALNGFEEMRHILSNATRSASRPRPEGGPLLHLTLANVPAIFEDRITSVDWRSS